jgi:hypothetical protein
VAEGDGLVGWWAAWVGLRSGRNGSWTLVHHGCGAKGWRVYSGRMFSMCARW